MIGEWKFEYIEAHVGDMKTIIGYLVRFEWKRSADLQYAPYLCAACIND